MKKWLKTVGLLQHIDLECNSGLGSETIRKIIRTELKKADKNNDGFIDEQEFSGSGHGQNLGPKYGPG